VLLHYHSMTLKIICLNLWEGGILIDNIIAFLRQQNADVLLLQEVHSGTDPSLPRQHRSIQVLQEELDYPHSNFAPAMLDIFADKQCPHKASKPKATSTKDLAAANNETSKPCCTVSIEAGNAILSKFPITHVSEPVFFSHPYRTRNAHDPREFPTTPRNLQHIVVQTPHAPINLYNFQGVFDMNGDNFSDDRKHMSQVIIDAIANKQYVIVAGDTNAKSTNKSTLMIEEHLHNVFGRELATSFNMRQKTNPGYATACVDMVFVSSDFEVVNKSCPDVDISDHLPLVVELRVA
jgi:endonuclease/exonuclease/phosphatase family metal-dependent hydrolase